MSEKETKPKWWDKLKKVKHIEVYIAVIFIVILLLIYLSNFSGKTSKSTIDKQQTISTYVNDLETNLESVLSNIGGVSGVKVMITLDMTNVTVTDEKLTIEKMPPIKGVLVTAKGVNNTQNRLKVLHAIEAVIDVTNGNIEILSSE